MSKLKVGLVFGGRSEEHEISILSAKSVLAVADRNKYEIIPLAITRDGYWLSPAESQKIVDNDLTEAVKTESNHISKSLAPFLNREFDVIFPLLHGPYGEDGKIQGLLEMLDLPYVGCGVLSSAVGMDKVFMKEIFSFHQLPQGRFTSLARYQFNHQKDEAFKEEVDKIIGYPCFIKPANMGSSIGVSRVDQPAELKLALTEAFRYDSKVVIEEFIEGREIECSVLGNNEIQASRPGEIKPEHDFYDYEAKYRDESTKLVIPAPVSDEVETRIRKIAKEAFKAIDGKGFARVDFFISKKDNNILINEVNTIPGFTEYSMYPKLWEISGIEYRELIDRLIKLALED